MFRWFRWDALGVLWVSSGKFRSEGLIAKVAQTFRLCMFTTNLHNHASRQSRSNVTPVHVSVIAWEGSWSPLSVLRRVSFRMSYCKSRCNVTPVHVSVICIAILCKISLWAPHRENRSNSTPVHISVISGVAPWWLQLKSGNINERVATDKLTKMKKVAEKSL